MSLVNDMLRDLDQRRKESEGTGVKVKLTPAAEFSENKKRNVVPFILLGLVVVVAALVYYWFQLNRSSTSSVPVNLVVQPPSVEITAEVPEAETVQAESALPEQHAIQEEQLVEAVAVAELNSVAEAQSVEVVSSYVDSQVEEEESNQQDGGSPNLIVEEQPSESTVATVDIRSDADLPTVKNTAEFTPEERDTLGVQEALELIANNRAADAFARLEQEISANRYAHQSRETYAKLLISQGRLEDAVALIDSGLSLAPNHHGYKKVKARLLIAAGELSAAIDLLMTRAPSALDDVEYHDLLASAQLASRDYEGAAVSYTSLVQIDQNQGKWWYGFAAAQDSLGNAIAARQAYTQAIQQQNLSASLRRRSQTRLTQLSSTN